MSKPNARFRGLDRDAITSLIDVHFPQVHEGNGRVTIEQAGGGGATVRMVDDPRMLRPGGTVSGPMMFKLADFAVYVAILAELGQGAMQAVTTNLNINFLSRPQPGDLIGHARLLKVGRRLAVAEVAIQPDGRAEIVAHATCTYAIPSEAWR